jgi:HEAT repeat protein
VDRLIDDPDHSVAEAATWAAGELCGADNRVAPPGEHDPALVAMVAKLSGNARHHDDALVREASVAALGSIGHRDGLDAVLAATADKPAVRRRAVIALAAFLGDPGVDEALTGATKDRDWQVRQAARILLDLPSEPE